MDAGQIRLHLRAPIGTRVEETAAVCDQVEQFIRHQIPASEISGILDNIGFPNSGINLTLSDSGVIGTSDAEVLVALTPDHRTKPVDYIRDVAAHPPPPISRGGVLFPAGGYRQSGPQLWIAGARRYPTGRAERSAELRSRPQAVAGAESGAGRRGRAHPSGLQSAAARHCRGPHQGPRGGHDPIRRGQQCPHLAHFKLPDRAELLAQSAGRDLQHLHADAAVPHGFAAGFARLAGHRREHGRRRCGHGNAALQREPEP